MSTVLVVAPHADDETIGCGGTLLRHVAAGDEVHWLVVTAPAGDAAGGSPGLLDEVAAAYGFRRHHSLGFAEARIDALPLLELVQAIGEVVRAVAPEVVYLPHRGDAHSDHRVVFDAAAACTKRFRFPSVRQVAAYETLSETDAALTAGRDGFWPNLYYGIAAELERKLDIMRLYASEMAAPPFPRNLDVLRALAAVRGAACGEVGAEAFVLLREVR